MKKLLLFTIICLACDNERVHVYYVADDLKVYVNQFFQEAAVNGKILEKDNIIVWWGKDSYRQCELGAIVSNSYVKNTQRYIDLNPIYQPRKETVYRELFHMLLDVPYSNSPTITIDGQTYDNLMYECYSPTNINQAVIDDLFN